MPRANLKNGILNFWRGQISDSIYHFLLVGIKRGDGFHIGFQKMDYVYFYGSSVRMGHKVYIIPILLCQIQEERKLASGQFQVLIRMN